MLLCFLPRKAWHLAAACHLLGLLLLIWYGYLAVADDLLRCAASFWGGFVQLRCCRGFLCIRPLPEWLLLQHLLFS